MKPKKNYVCPRCDYPLIPVHAVEGSQRRVIALACPEPYCDHMQMIPRRRSAEFDVQTESRESTSARAAN